MVQKDAEQESEMRAEIQVMKKEQSSISMMDEFARYARLERKINKMTDKLKTHGGRIEGVTETGTQTVDRVMGVPKLRLIFPPFFWENIRCSTISDQRYMQYYKLLSQTF